MYGTLLARVGRDYGSASVVRQYERVCGGAMVARLLVLLQPSRVYVGL